MTQEVIKEANAYAGGLCKLLDIFSNYFCYIYPRHSFSVTMSITIEMKPLLNLDCLPPDIIRRIIHMESDSATEMRLISHEWDALAKNVLTENAKLPAALERVYFSRGVPEEMYEGRKVRETRAINKEDLHMYAIFPERHAKRVGMDGWIHKYKKYGTDQIEVFRFPEQLSRFLNPYWRVPFYINIIVSALLLCLIICRRNSVYNGWAVAAMLLSLAGVSLFALLALARLAKKEQREILKINRFFAMFTHIDTLVLDNFRRSRNDRNARDAIKAALMTLKGVRINRLEVRERDLNKHLRSLIIQMCRDHFVRNVLISATDFDSNGFSDFVEELSKMDVTLDLYEVNGMSHRFYFCQTRLWWTNMQTYLRTSQILLRMATIHDTSYERPKFCYRVKSHIRCEKDDGNSNAQPLKPVPWRRGFNHRST